MFYCRPNKHEYRIVLQNDKIYSACKNCRCCKLRPEATKRFTDNIKDFDYNTAVKLAGF